VRGPLLAGLVLAGAVAFPAAAPAAHRPKVAQFRFTLTVWQKTTWTQELTSQACGGGEFLIHGHGESKIKMHTASVQRLVIRRVHKGGHELALQVGDGPPQVQMIGTLTRNGSDSAEVVVPGTPGACPAPEQVPVDCGTRTYPASSRIGIASYPWPNTKRRHAGDVIYLTGPYTPEWSAGPPFGHCLSAGRDDLLLGSVIDESPAEGALVVDTVFGRKRHFEIAAESTLTVDHMKGAAGSGLTGTRPVTTTSRWRLRLTRVGHRKVQHR
jgi:hypothetical protein